MNNKHSISRGIGQRHSVRPRGSHPARTSRHQGTGNPPYWLIGLFALYGLTVNLLGEWRYTEIILLGLLFLNIKQALKHVGKLERRFILLFLLAAGAHAMSDIINDAISLETLKRVGTYGFLAIIVIAVQWISRKDANRIWFIFAGYCTSFVLLLFTGMSTNSDYADLPWRLGLGNAVTLALCLAIATIPRFRRFGGVALIMLAAFHIVMDARSLAGMTAITGLLTMLAKIKGNRFPPRFRLNFVALVGVLSIVAITGGMFLIKTAVENKLFANELQAKMERQLSHPYGLLAAGRPQTITAIYAISKRPVFGYGTTAYDADVHGFFIELGSLMYDQTWAQAYESNKLHFAIPSHSHIFSAWADAGILAAICWFAFLALIIHVLVRAMFWSNSWAPLFVFCGFSMLWAVLFSPGPIRLEIALMLMIFSFAVHQFKIFDKIQRN